MSERPRDLTDDELAGVGVRIDQVVIDTIRKKLNIDPKVKYVLKNDRPIAYEVTLTWTEFTILAMPHLSDEPEISLVAEEEPEMSRRLRVDDGGLLGHSCSNSSLPLVGNWSDSVQQAPDGTWCFWWVEHEDGGVCHDAAVLLTKRAREEQGERM